MSKNNEIVAVLRQALEALEWMTAAEPWDEPDVNKAITSLRQAIAEESLCASSTAATQEPVAYVTGVYAGRFTYAPIKASVVLPVGMALYTHPQPKAEQGPDTEAKRLADLVELRIESIADRIVIADKLRNMKKAEQGCDYCKHTMFVGAKCKNCGKKAEQEPKRELTDEQADAILETAEKMNPNYVGWVRDQRRAYVRAGYNAAHSQRQPWLRHISKSKLS